MMQDSHVKVQRELTPTSSYPPITTLNPSLPTPPRTPSTHVEGDGPIRELSPAARMEPPKGTDRHQDPVDSILSLDSASSHRSRKEYMDSLVPPSSEEMSRIAQTQLQREKEEKRKARDRGKEARKSIDASRNSLDVQHDNASRSPRHGSLLNSLSIHRHKKSNSISETHPQQGSSIAAAAVASVLAAGLVVEDGDDLLQHRAATLIQRTYRGHKTRREMRGLGLDADTRWTHAIKELRFREATMPRSGREDDTSEPVGSQASGVGQSTGENEAARRSSAARSKWKKVAAIAGRAAGNMEDDPTSSSDSESASDSNLSASEKRQAAHQKREELKARRRKDSRMMGLQYFLEMVDLKHRYGSNLRTYHEEWKRADTKEPFFYWLDYGEGKNIDMASCPRERLDREQVRYLSREERQHYLVKVDAEGRLCWAKNGMRIDTTEKWKDSIHGIVPEDDPTPAFQPNTTNPNHPRLFASDSSPSSPTSLSSTSSSPSTTPSESEREVDRAAKYASPGVKDAKGYKKVTHLSVSTIINSMLRKSVRKNTWIFVADTSFRLYVGIKDSGAFQHSSFVQGSRITAAGLIKIKNGRLTSLSPLSGHYRPPTSNFRAFVRSLKDEGVDMSRVSISKSYAVLVGLELYVRTRQKGKRLVQRAAHGKDRVVHPAEVQRREEAARDKSESAEKERRFLERARAEEEGRRDETRAAVKVLHKLGIAPAAAPEGPKEGANGGSGSNGEAVATAAAAAAAAADNEAEGELAAAAASGASAAGGVTTSAADEKTSQGDTLGVVR